LRASELGPGTIAQRDIRWVVAAAQRCLFRPSLLAWADMTSTIIITRALRDASIDLLREVRDRAEAGALEAEHHMVSMWATNTLLRAREELTEALVSAQDRFRSYAPANSRWLEVLNALLSYGGDECVPGFAKNLLRAFLFHLQTAADALWADYQDMQRQVIIETGQRLPPTWGEWIVPMQMFMGLLETRLVAENPIYQLLFASEVARELAIGLDGAKPQTSRSLAPIPLSANYDFDLVATLTAYLNWCIEQVGWLDPGGYARTPNPSVPLEGVFVPLQLAPLEACRPERRSARYQESASQLPDGPSPTEVDLETCDPIGVSQALEASGCMLVLGPTGTGKSTLLRHLALEHARLMCDDLAERPQGINSPADLADRAPMRVPIYLSLAAFIERRDEDESLTDFILRSLGSGPPRNAQVAEVLLGALQAGCCLVLLDDLDSALDDGQRRMLITAVNEFAAQWREYGNQVVASGRLEDWSTQLEGGFHSFVLCPLDRSQIGTFALQWLLTLERAYRPMISDQDLYHLADRQNVALMAEIRASERLLALAGNPLRLRMMIGISRQGIYLPGERVGLYEVAAEALIREWRLPEDMPTETAVTSHEVVALLSELAYWLHASRPTGLASEHEIVSRLSDLWLEMHPQASQAAVDEAVDEFMSRLRHFNGVLIEVAPRRYGFISRAFQEYFAARWLVWRHRAAARRIRQHLHDPHWEGVISLAIGFVSLHSPADASELIEAAILARGPIAAAEGFRPSPYEEMLQRDLFLAARLLGGEVHGETEVVRHVAERLAGLWMHADRDSLGRFGMIADQARRCLTRLGSTAGGYYALQRIIEGLASPSEHVRAHAADGLSFWPEYAPQAVEVLAGRCNDSSPLVKRAVAQALGRLQVLTREAYNCLIRLSSDPDPKVAEAANHALENAPPVPESELRLWVELLHDENPANRRLGARVLQRVGRLPPRVVGELLNLIGDPNPSVREAVTNALARVAVLSDDALIAICRAVDKDERVSVQVAAIGALSRPVVLPDAVIERLIEWAKDANPEVRIATTRTLGTCHNNSNAVMRTLDDLLDDPVEMVRQRTVEVLAVKGGDNPDIVHTLLHAVSDDSPSVRSSLGRSLGALRELASDVRRTLLALLNDHHYSVREAAMRSVPEIADPGEPIVQQLVSLVREREAGCSSAAITALAALRGLPTCALLALVDALPDHVTTRGDAIAECLRAHSPLCAELIHALIDLALGGSGAARQIAIDVIGYSLDSVPGVLEALMQLVEGQELEWRRAAILSLSHASQLPDHAIARLFQMLDGDVLEVRQAAAVALARLSRRLPGLWLNREQVINIANRLYTLLHELPPRAAWESGGDTQNETLNALNWVARYIRSRD
jgi:HEAT repeat protein